MSFITGFYASISLFAALVLVSGLVFKLVQYSRTPAPLKIPTTPAPTSWRGVVLRMTRELLFFESGFYGNHWTWVIGWLLHIGLLLVFMRHLRYFLNPVPELIRFMQPLGVLGGWLMLFALLGRWVRRLSVDRLRYCSTPSDHLLLALLLTIVVSGLVMTLLVHTDIVAVKAFFLGLVVLDPTPLPDDPVLLVHLTMVAILMIIFPYRKLLHAPAFFFNPSRYRVDDPRERRHLVPWASRYEQP
jgi:nitrate reductase gamma subunit